MRKDNAMPTGQTHILSPAEREKLITDNLPLVKFCVARMNMHAGPSGLDFEDLVAHGTVGLIQAADRYDDAQGAKFSIFAATRIRGAIIDAMRTLDPVGRANRRVSRRIGNQFDSLAMELGRNPTPSEVQASANIADAQYWNARRTTDIKLVSFDVPMGEVASLSETLSDQSPPVSFDIERRELSQALGRAIAELPERDKTVLSLYYVESLSMKEVARTMDISETRVSQLLNRSYARLRHNSGLAAAA